MNIQDLENKIKSEAAWTFDRQCDLGVIGGERYAYYQGRIDALETVLKMIYGEVKVGA
jgi:arabinogalactan endo-1,4-beta-galactosidase